MPGSTHGYDGIDPTRINPELGGEAGALMQALEADLKRLKPIVASAGIKPQ